MMSESASNNKPSFLRRFFDRLSLKKKIITMIAGVSCLVVIAAMLSSFAIELVYFKERLTYEYRTAAKMLSRNLEAAVLFENEKDCREILGHLSTYGTIANAGVYTMNGDVLATFKSPSYDEDLPLPAMSIFESVEGRWILISEDIVVDGSKLGFLMIRADSGDLYNYLLARGGVLLLLLLIAVVFAGLLGLKLSKYVSEPIIQLTRVAKSISLSKDYSTRQQRVSDDETGELVDAFNEMIEEIDSRNEVILANEERFRRYFELGVVGMAVLDENLKWIDFNATLLDILGYSREELTGNSFISILSNDTGSSIEADLREYLLKSNSGFVGECWIIGADSRRVFTIASFRGVVDAVSGTKQHILLLQDITERKYNEEELIEAKEEAERSSRSKDEFLSIMSHELRTPLNPILGFSELLKGQLKDPEDLECVSIISKSASHLLDLIGDILDYTRIDRGIDRIEKSKFDYLATTNDIVNSFKVQAGSKNLDLHVSHFLDGVLLKEGQKLTISTDQTKFKQVLQNIVSNAMKFTQAGCVSVSTKLTLANVNPSMLYVEVRDTGIGIVDGDKSKVFEAFSQVDGSMTRKYGGIGLGMAISKKMVEGLNGCIDFNSTVGVGTHFWFEIPVSIIEIEGAATKDVQVHTNTLNKRLGEGVAPVLLVEDEPNNRQLATLLLRSRGFEVVVAEDGARALSLIDETQFSMILMDLQMPVLDGYDATRQIRAMESINRMAPIIALTAHADEAIQRKCERVGMDDFLAKPFNPEQFVEKLVKWSSRKS